MKAVEAGVERRARGSFGYQAAIGLTPAYWEPGFNEQPFMGLPAAGQHVAGGVRLADGTSAFAIRHFQNEVAARFLLYRARAGAPYAFDPAGQAAYGGLCEVGGHDGLWGLRQPAGRFAFLHGRDEARWHEHDLVDLTLRPRLDGLQVAVPDAEEPLGYLCRGFDVVSGTVGDLDVVDGFLIHEQVHLRSGRGWAQSRYKQRLQGDWMCFATRFADGTLHWGHLCWSREGWGFAVVQRTDGHPLVVHRPPAEFELDDEGYPLRCAFDLGAGGVWEWRPPDDGPGAGRIPLPGPADHVPRWCDGVVRQIGDEREVDFAMSWNELYPPRL